MVSDADCVTPVETVCGVALPSPDCQLVLRQFFNGSGEFCVNVSLTNDVSLAVTSARVSVTVGTWGLFFILYLFFLFFYNILSAVIQYINKKNQNESKKIKSPIPRAGMGDFYFLLSF